MQQLINEIWLQTQQRLRLGDQAFLGHVHCNLESRWGCALSIAGLQHVELALLDGELNVLHVLPRTSYNDLYTRINCGMNQSVRWRFSAFGDGLEGTGCQSE